LLTAGRVMLQKEELQAVLVLQQPEEQLLNLLENLFYIHRL